MGQSGAQSKSRQLPLIPQQHCGERVLEKDGGETKASPLWGGVGGKSASKTAKWKWMSAGRQHFRGQAVVGMRWGSGRETEHQTEPGTLWVSGEVAPHRNNSSERAG